MNRPLLTRAARLPTVVIEAIDEHGATVPTAIAGEHPLTLYVDKREVVTLMTLGGAPEALAIVYLRNQRLVSGLDEIAAVQVDWETESCAVTTRKGVKDLRQKTGKRTVTSGCGQGTMFGDLMSEIDSIKLRDDVTLADEQLFALIERVRKHETIYKQAGAVHGCALATRAGEIRIWPFFRASSGLAPCDVPNKYASGPSPCGCPMARPSPRSRHGVSCIMRAGGWIGRAGWS